MESVERTGRNVEEAVSAALKALDASREEVEVEVLAEESRGILGSILGYSSAKVRVTRKAPLVGVEVRERAVIERETPPVERIERERPAPRQPAPPAPRDEGAEYSELAFRAAEIADELVELMGINAHAVIVNDDLDAVSLDMQSEDDLALLIGKHGQTLSALQLIVAMMANRDASFEERRRIMIDAEGYRARRDQALESMARSAAERAKRSGQPVTISALTPRERRIIHVTLADDRSVSTRSEGEDPDRTIIITARSREGY